MDMHSLLRPGTRARRERAAENVPFDLVQSTAPPTELQNMACELLLQKFTIRITIQKAISLQKQTRDISLVLSISPVPIVS
jgi:hypothetical protein